jgi:hypothetical protein
VQTQMRGCGLDHVDRALPAVKSPGQVLCTSLCTQNGVLVTRRMKPPSEDRAAARPSPQSSRLSEWVLRCQ